VQCSLTYPSPIQSRHAVLSMLSSFISRRFSSSSGVAAPAEANSDDGTLPTSEAQLACDNASDSPPHKTPASIRDANAGPTLENRPTTLIDRFRRYSSFSRPAQDAVVEEDGHDLNETTITAPIAIPVPVITSMPQDSSHILDDELRQLNLEPTVPSAPATPTGLSHGPTTIARNATTIPESLPADDGMAHLRARIHQIRDLKISEQEQARMVHSLMTERYNYMRPTSPSSFVSHDRPFTPASSHSVFSDAQASSDISAASDIDPENPYSLRPGDTNPTYRPLREHHSAENGEEEEDDHTGDAPALGCQHYKRNVKVQCFECQHWYTCRHCHDAMEDHNLNRKLTQHMLCMVCGTPQKAGDYCSNCQTESACYYCDICKLWDNNSKKQIYHCPDCGICRRGAGLGKDFYHCKVSSPIVAMIQHNLNMHRIAMFASAYHMQKSTNVLQVPLKTTVLSALRISSRPPLLLFLCPVGTTYTRTVTTSTWRQPTSVPSARRAPLVWPSSGRS
jgi:uncharacterized CHY-type Zn-finger protein